MLKGLIQFDEKSRTTWIGFGIVAMGIFDAVSMDFDLGLSPIITILLGLGIVTNRAALQKITDAASERL